MTTGSLELRRYLALRRAGTSRDEAAAAVGFNAELARLTDAAEQRGELADIGPAPTTQALGSPGGVGPGPCPAAPAREDHDMARKARAGDSGNNGVTNLTETKQVIKDAVAKILSWKNDRKEINAAIAEQRARVKNYGVPPAALDLALRMKEADPEDRQKHDEGYVIARDALGLGLQRSLFESLEEREGAEKKSADAKAGKGEKPVEVKGEIAKAAAAAGMIPGAEALAKGKAHLSAVPDAVN